MTKILDFIIFSFKNFKLLENKPKFPPLVSCLSLYCFLFCIRISTEKNYLYSPFIKGDNDDKKKQCHEIA